MTVWMLPGQGAQKPAMGVGLLGSAEFERVCQVGSEILGVDMRYLATEADEDEVNQPFNAQALTMAVSVAAGRILLAQGVRPTAVLGFSLGQISALALSGVLSLEDTFSLLKVRAEAMSRACVEAPGAMLALIGPIANEAQELCSVAAEGRVLEVANHNCPGQMVVSGDIEAIERCEQLIRSRKGKCTRLNTAGAFHTPLMHQAAIAVQHACGDLAFHEGDFPVICNTDAGVFQISEAADRLSRQVESPVLFEESVRSLLQQGETEFVEVGFGKVLSGLMKRIDRSAKCMQVGDIDQARGYFKNRKAAEGER